jgi:bifunctional DNA-binding transcriptional regulator/antitoxin component of YhaV-PrlF toxin-antitoxin module
MIRYLKFLNYGNVGVLMKVWFDTKKIQKLGRVSLSEMLLRNAGLSEGDTVNIYFDANTRCIVLERANAQEKTLEERSSTTSKPGKKK